MRRNIPKLQTLLTFESAARHENFSRAAEDMNITQGAISRQVILLEDRLGYKLFLRAHGRIYLTDAGHRLLHEISPLLDSLETTISNLASIQSDERDLVIGTYPTLATRWLSNLQLEFNSAHPEVKTRIVTILANVDFDPTNIDLAILQGEPPWSGMDARLLMDEALVVAGSPALLADSCLGMTPSALPHLPYLRQMTRAVSFQIWSESAGEPLPEPDSGTVFEQYDAMIEAAVGAHGIGVFPLVLIERELATGQLVLAHPHIAQHKAAYYLLIPEQNTENRKLLLFRDWILAQSQAKKKREKGDERGTRN